jgi:glutamyl-tRNA synthetase
VPYKKTRIAPTPSGYLHLGNVLSFAITAALAHKEGAKILLRIDDIDQARVNKLYVQDIFDTLNFLEIPWDEGPRNFKEYESNYSQLHRVELYQQTLEQLKDEGKVFACTCSRQQIMESSGGIYPGTCLNKPNSLDAENVNWRLLTEPGKELVVNIYGAGTTKAMLPASMQYFIIKKKDGFPSYQLTSVIDDLHYGVDLVVRGRDLWDSTLAQHELALNLKTNPFHDTAFYHHPLLIKSGKKLSKSAGDTSVRYLRANGKKPADIYALIAEMLNIKGEIINWKDIAEKTAL